MTRGQQKQEALARMKILQMSDEVIFQFREYDKIFVSYLDVDCKMLGDDHRKKFLVVPFEPWADALLERDISRIENCINFIETEYGGLVYHICVQGTEVVLLYASQWDDEWKDDRWDICGCRPQVAGLLTLDGAGQPKIGRAILEPACGGVVRRE